MEEKQNKNKKNKKKNNGLGFVLWLFAALLILILFLINLNRILSNLKKTGFFDNVFGKTPQVVQNAQIQDSDEDEKNDVEPESSVQLNLIQDSANEAEEFIPNVQVIETEQKDEEKVKAQDTAKDKDIAKEKTEENKQNSDVNASLKNQEEKKQNKTDKTSESVKKEQPKASENKPVQKMNVKLCFIVKSNDGSFYHKEITRALPKSQSPLKDAINALLAGPDSSEIKQGCESVISEGTKLLGVSIKNGVATLNLSGNFEYNSYGIEGLKYELMQVVYTATAFPTVEKVQFLIDGEKRDFLGQEGLWISTPLSRSSFY